MIMRITHNELRDLLKKIGRIIGYESVIEYKTPKGRIDLVWKKGKEFIAFEIENKNGKSGQLKNLIKVLDIRPTKFIPIFYDYPEISKELKGLSGVYPIYIMKDALKNANKDNLDKLINKLYYLEINKELKVKKFVKQTGYGRATYYRRIRMLKKKLEKNEYDKKD